ncbi:uncharacterized protein LOC106667542 isoform X1 [Cimex lectularius]|uniref:WW domain-containing protein n=1 Tax=Cimex lectularius TaxID=79782 RepID=A0A8I6SUZ7_CIMLE|nr:uncharacterized protein LOC106667542 isoform X1 [Cimex lectularius]
MSQVRRLPPGWDTKCEPRTGKSYFVNYFTRHVTLEDPRNKDQGDGQNHHHHLPQIQENVRGGRHVPFMGASAVQSNTQHSQQIILAETVQKIRSMFPTVPETHIKALLLK